ncbi:DUF3010 family protein [Oceanobacter sp. 3_MG-2023]|uniref:DUF3010 family protein n=1 Tax=Oceanobacter sp. 3_MG-2023 TaxID=3062622 RepID=UPI0027345071|nr:DUF3010 family protein [Oceanobacter sp. 3_MG-2023]MDP2505830.1 DUF3010 family protein [Oceanobacter sp. 3_MG-2023]
MKICGIELKGSDARLAVIKKTDQGFEHCDVATKKIPLGDGECSIQAKSFMDTFESFCRDNAIDLICIKKRGKKGEYAGGPDTFKMEGIIQVSNVPAVSLISPQSIAAMQKREEVTIPDELNKYQHSAYLTAITGAA